MYVVTFYEDNRAVVETCIKREFDANEAEKDWRYSGYRSERLRSATVVQVDMNVMHKRLARRVAA